MRRDLKRRKIPTNAKTRRLIFKICELCHGRTRKGDGVPEGRLQDDRAQRGQRQDKPLEREAGNSSCFGF